MTCLHLQEWMARIRLCRTLALLAIVGFAIILPAHAQTYSVLFNFPTGGGDGLGATSTLLRDRSGRFYGTIAASQACPYGLVYQFKPSGSGWIYNPLHCFNRTDGYEPIIFGGLTVGPDGAYYGTTVFGGSGGGTVFKINPGAMACTTALCPWPVTVLGGFISNGGVNPFSNVIFDAAGNLYGTTQQGTPNGGGLVYKLTRSGNQWNETVLYNFTDVHAEPDTGVVMDAAGNLYGTLTYSGIQSCTFGCGLVYELSPTAGGGYTEQVLHQFTAGDDGSNPAASLVFDQAGNLFGSTTHGGNFGGGGTIFELSPSAGGGWTFNTLCGFAGNGGPRSPLTMDAGGSFYGTTEYDGHGAGSVFKVVPSAHGWTCSDLYRFSFTDGGYEPIGGVTLDPSGNLFGTTSDGGANNGGVFWEITP